MKRILIILSLATFTFAQSFSQSQAARFEEASKLYQSGDYSGAAAIYNQLYNEGYRSENLLYNSGNAFFKSGDIAHSILFYERAKLLSPADEDINYNLEVARSRVAGKTEEIPSLFFIRWFDFLALLTGTNNWAIIALLLFIIALASGIVFLTKARSQGKLLTFWIFIGALMLSAISVSLAIRNDNLVNNNRKAVVICSILTGKSAPGESGNEIFVVNAGAIVVIEESIGDFTEVRLPDGNKGWVKGDCIEKI